VRLLARLVLLVVGLSLAVPAGAVALAVGAALEPSAHGLAAAIGAALIDAVLADAHGAGATAGRMALGLWALAGLVLVAPPALAALVGEAAGLRSFAWYGGVSGALTAALPWLLRARDGVVSASAAEGRLTALLFVAGAVAGLTYWLVSGRSAGAPRPALPPAWGGPAAGPR